MIYLDVNATTPLEPDVAKVLRHYFEEEYGNAGSRTHDFGAKALKAVQKAREQIAHVVGAQREEVVFTSGATEANNLAILGLRQEGLRTGRRHVITTSVEHKAVLEPFAALERDGFDVTTLPVGKSGAFSTDDLACALRDDTLLVSLMHANNETGIVQPIEAAAGVLGGHPAYLHTDAAQTFGKLHPPLKCDRIDLISISGHKIFGPKGIGALIARRRRFTRPPLAPLMFGGGQEYGLRPGTLPVPLVAGFGVAAELALQEAEARQERCRKDRHEALAALAPLKPHFIGDQSTVLDHVLNFSVPQLDSEALMIGVNHLVAISNGSACTSSSYTPSHVLTAMGYDEDEANSCVRVSWCHLTPAVDWDALSAAIAELV